MKKDLRLFSSHFKWIALLLFAVSAIKASGQNYKDWDYTPHSVFGLIKLDNTTNRTYYKITRPDAQTTRVKEINAAGITVNTTVVRDPQAGFGNRPVGKNIPNHPVYFYGQRRV